MGKVNYNVKGVEAGGGDFVEAPVGLYVGKIVEAPLETPADKDKRIHVQIELVGKGRSKEKLDPPKGSQYGRLHDYVNLVSEAAAFKLKQYLIATGKVDEDDAKTEKGSFDPEKDWVGKEVLVRVRHEMYDGEPRAKPGNVMLFEAEDAEDPDDEDPDDEPETDDADDGDDDGDDGDDDTSSDEEDDELWTQEELEELDDKALAEEAFNAEDDEDNPGFGLDKSEFVKKKGKKKVLDRDKVIAAILEAQEEDDDDSDDDDADGDDDYESWDADKLKAELKERELKVSGKFSKAKAIKALQADDEEDPF